MLPPIRGFIESTLLDWEGKVAAVVFLPGCNFRCGYCHARHLVEPAPSDEAIPLEAVLLSFQRQRGWLDGVVISGGEPTVHPGLLSFIRQFREQRIAVKLDTNGSRPDVLEQLLALGVLDYVAMDVKGPLDGKYAEIARAPVDLAAIRRSIEILIRGETPYEFRTTVCPDMLDADEVERTAMAVRGARVYYLQAFRPVNCLDRHLEDARPYNPDQMRELCRRAARHVQRCVVRGDQASELAAAGAAGVSVASRK
jgi:pyruvate formate lyase activating enzyme